VAFGRRAPDVAPIARYFVKNAADRWVAVPLDEFKQHRKMSRDPARGTLELLGQRAQVHSVDSRGLHRSWELPIAPVFLQDGTASTIFDAFSKAVPSLDVPQMVQLSQEIGALRWIHSSVSEYNTLLESPLEACAVHQEHNVAVSASRHDALIGDVHACSIVHKYVNAHNKMTSALARIVERDLQWERVILPPPEWRAHARAVLEFTLGGDARGCTDADGNA
ncbi:unnamed protein product, partial [Prorocentrum cordatum]